MDLLRQHIKQGDVYRRSDLEYYSTAIDRHLAQLTKDGTLMKLNQGLYYAPMQSKFGTVPPDDHIIVERFLKDDNFLIISPNMFNALGLGLTQLYNSSWVYNHKRKGEVEFNNRKFEFRLKASFPKNITKEYLLVELLNNLDRLAEDNTQLLDKLKKNILNYNSDLLIKATQQYGIGETKQTLKKLLRSILKKDLEIKAS
jgi:hypothetical protein